MSDVFQGVLVKLSVLMPAHNEEVNIHATLVQTLEAFDALRIDGEVMVIDDGSIDQTGPIVTDMSLKDRRVKLLKNEKPMGYAYSFWNGVDHTQSDAIVLIPGNNEHDPLEVLRYFSLLKDVDIIIPFLYNKGDRTLFRNVLSFGFRTLINSTFLVNFNYTTGTVIYRRSLLEQIKYRSNGFLFQTDILIRTVKSGYLFCETPYRVNFGEPATSKVGSLPSILKVFRGYLRLVRDFYLSPDGNEKLPFTKDSLSFKRYNP